MCKNCGHKGITAFASSKNSVKDPTRTSLLRSSFAKAFNRRFRIVEIALRKAIVNDNILGLGLVVNAKYTTTSKKLENFEKWLEYEIDKTIHGTLMDGSYWTDTYVKAAYKQGIGRAKTEAKRIKVPVPTVQDAVEMNLEPHAARVKLLTAQTVSELKGITSQMQQQIMRVLSDGILKGQSTKVIAKRLVAAINGKGIGNLGIVDVLGRYIPAKRRAEILAQTATVKVHHLANIQEYRNLGIEDVTIVAEFTTAGDLKVCPKCAALNGNTYTLDVIEYLIPMHARCRCFARPKRIKS